MKYTFNIQLTIITVLSLCSCNNDLEILAPDEESISVYGILNPNEPIQKIRINKVYLTNGDALVAAQDVNQINYGPGELYVTLQRFMPGSTIPALTTVNNNLKKEIVLTETVVTTASGNFNTNQRIWQTSDKLYNSGEYKLSIKNLITGKEFSSQTVMVDSIQSYPAMPIVFIPSSYPVHCGVGPNGYSGNTTQSAYVDFSVLPEYPRVIKFKSVANARLYKVIMRFHYIDSLAGGSVNMYRRFVDFNFPSQLSSTLIGGEEMQVSFNTQDFYTNLANQIPKQTTGYVKSRYVHYMEYIIFACSENLVNFLKINKPSNTISQDKPNYTNIKGGVGIFASTSKTSLGKELWFEFTDEISDNPATVSLLFVKDYAFRCP